MSSLPAQYSVVSLCMQRRSHHDGVSASLVILLTMLCIMPCHVSLHYVAHRTAPHRAAPRRAAPCHVIPHHTPRATPRRRGRDVWGKKLLRMPRCIKNKGGAHLAGPGGWRAAGGQSIRNQGRPAYIYIYIYILYVAIYVSIYVYIYIYVYSIK